MSKIKVNLYGETFKHNLVDGFISSTPNKIPKNLNFVTDKTGELNFYIDHAIFDVDKNSEPNKNFGWLIESNSIHPEIVISLKNEKTELTKYFNKIFTHNSDLLKLNSTFQFMFPIGYWVNRGSNIKKTKLISMITSNKQHTDVALIRYKFAKKYLNKIDIFGKGFHPIKLKEIGLEPYMFSVVIENDLTPDYFSEKLLDCFATKTIPIYLGCKNISKYFDINGIILFENFNIEDISSNLYNKLLSHVETNYNKVTQYEIPENIIFDKYLRIQTDS